MIKALIFDWGDTIMRDYPEKEGPMYLWLNVKRISGVYHALQKLCKNFIMVIATNAGQSDTEAMIKALRRVDTEKFFKYFFSSKDLGFEKPDVRFFLSISEQIQIPANECAMIGNLYEKDIIGAKNCGMFTVLFNEHKLTGPFEMADKVITSMESLPEIFL
jgi:FMN phosphatase YigB (HAD superfamily)